MSFYALQLMSLLAIKQELRRNAAQFFEAHRYFARDGSTANQNGHAIRDPERLK